MSNRKPSSPAPVARPDYSEIEAALENCKHVVSDLTNAHHRYGSLREDEIAHFDRLAKSLEEYLRAVCSGVLREEIATHGGNVEDPSDVARLQSRSVSCALAFHLRELAAAVGGWGAWPCNAPYEAACAAYVGYRDQQQAEEYLERKESKRRQRISAKKIGKKRPSRIFAEAYATADKIVARHPGISDLALHSRIERILPEGTNLPSVRQLRRYRTGH